MVRYEDILEAAERIRGRLAPTPLLRHPGFGGPRLKAELFQITGSFKARGALNWIAGADKAQLAGGLVTVSAGNHAKALAWAARTAGAKLTVFMPEGSSPIKVSACRDLGAEVILHGSINETWAKAREVAASRNLTLVHPYDDPRIIAGQGTVGLEIVDQFPEVERIVVPVGGGGLISGIALAVKSRVPSARVVGVEPEGAATLAYAWQHGGPETLPKVTTLAASLGANRAGELTYRLSREYVDELVTVSDVQIVEAFRAVLNDAKLYAEPGACVGVAACRAGKIDCEPGTSAVVITGGNLDSGLARELLGDVQES